jgi:hypothetical protein
MMTEKAERLREGHDFSRAVLARSSVFARFSACLRRAYTEMEMLTSVAEAKRKKERSYGTDKSVPFPTAQQ